MQEEIKISTNNSDEFCVIFHFHFVTAAIREINPFPAIATLSLRNAEKFENSSFINQQSKEKF